jgi:hypothetical protein
MATQPRHRGHRRLLRLGPRGTDDPAQQRDSVSLGQGLQRDPGRRDAGDQAGQARRLVTTTAQWADAGSNCSMSATSAALSSTTRTLRSAANVRCSAARSAVVSGIEVAPKAVRNRSSTASTLTCSPGGANARRSAYSCPSTSSSATCYRSASAVFRRRLDPRSPPRSACRPAGRARRPAWRDRQLRRADRALCPLPHLEQCTASSECLIARQRQIVGQVRLAVLNLPQVAVLAAHNAARAR